MLESATYLEYEKAVETVKKLIRDDPDWTYIVDRVGELALIAVYDDEFFLGYL